MDFGINHLEKCRLVMYDTATSELWYSGSNAGSANKTFVIDHPDDSDKYLVHVCLEGPEAVS